MKRYADDLAHGKTVQFRPRGNSMTPIISSGQLVTVEPLDRDTLQLGDVVLAKVRGQFYLHKVVGVDKPRRRVQIGNNHGHINGWTNFSNVYGRMALGGRL